MDRGLAILLGALAVLAVLVLLFVALVFWALPADARPRPRYTALELVAEIQRAEREHGLPPGLLCSVVMHESNGRWIVTPESRGRASVGVAQVLV